VALVTGGRYTPGGGWQPVAEAGAPEARFGSVEAWTGSEMLVWGGDRSASPYETQLVATGGAYDPVGDRWRALSEVDAPVAREFHTAVWTGSELIVWGGSDGRQFLSDGGRYAP
jgi:N-acetylneuraminic acid mutarotase